MNTNTNMNTYKYVLIIKNNFTIKFKIRKFVFFIFALKNL